MAYFLRLMRDVNGLLLLRAAVAAKLCCAGEFFSTFATVDHGYFLMKNVLRRTRGRARIQAVAFPHRGHFPVSGLMGAPQ